jgi:hypothetical protein
LHIGDRCANSSDLGAAIELQVVTSINIQDFLDAFVLTLLCFHVFHRSPVHVKLQSISARSRRVPSECRRISILLFLGLLKHLGNFFSFSDAVVALLAALLNFVNGAYCSIDFVLNLGVVWTVFKLNDFASLLDQCLVHTRFQLPMVLNQAEFAYL